MNDHGEEIRPVDRRVTLPDGNGRSEEARAALQRRRQERDDEKSHTSAMAQE